jgi:alpha-D-ribose 1-methylphosphonate 5-triphosphate synthase subunit PhnH
MLDVSSGTSPGGPIAPGFADPVFDSQATFRAALDALARPGRVVPLAPLLTPPAPLNPTAAALCLALADLDTPLWLDPAADSAAVRDYLRFHSGAPLVAGRADATFAVLAAPATAADFEGFAPGTPEYPDRSATLIVQVAGFAEAGGVTLSGPGIESHRGLAVDGLPEGFWTWARANHAGYPLGVDVLFAAPDRVAGLPRSTAVEDA